MKRVIITFEHDSSTYSGLWREYYSKFFDEVKVVDINDVIREDWAATYSIMNLLQEEYFMKYDMIVYADIDEFLIPDPDKYKDLGDYLDQVREDVVRCTGYNVIQSEQEDELDFSKPILKQRKYWGHDEFYDKYVVLTRPQVYISNHSIDNPRVPVSDLVMVHLRDADIKTAKQRSESLGREYDMNSLKRRREDLTLIPDKYKVL